MICPTCNCQMHQKDKQGGGYNDETKYVTWEVKICPQCGREVKETYSAEVINEPQRT